MRRFSPREINWLAKFAKPDSWREVSQTSPTSQMPVEYITGWAEFRGRDFEVNKNVLIPRIETEQLVDEAVKILTPYSLLSTPYSPVIADIGTGCGCIGITLYLELVKLGVKPIVYLSDISKEALKITRYNLHKHYIHRFEEKRSPLKLLKSNLLFSYPKNLKFDLIVANLPYIPSKRIPKLPESVKDFEPLLAINGGPDGLKLINKLITQSELRLKPNGVLLLEIDESHKIKDLSLPKNFQAEIIKDQFGKRRFVKIFPAEQERIKDIGEICQDTRSQSKNH